MGRTVALFEGLLLVVQAPAMSEAETPTTAAIRVRMRGPPFGLPKCANRTKADDDDTSTFDA
ncbi:MAG: hypothetical protein OXG44_15825 [Gammaproteobacteria bacterium]|nr:hypothetical protein [Gammaproteobacteria bacterium]